MNDLTLFLHTEPVIIAVIVGVITGFIGSALFYEFARRHRQTYMEQIFALQRKQRLEGLLSKLLTPDDSTDDFLSAFNDKIYTLPKFDPNKSTNIDIPLAVGDKIQLTMKYFIDDVSHIIDSINDDLRSTIFSEFFEPHFNMLVYFYISTHYDYMDTLFHGHYRSFFIHSTNRHMQDILDYLKNDSVLKKSPMVKDFSQKWKKQLEGNNHPHEIS